MFKFEEIDKTPHFPAHPVPTPCDPENCPVSGCFPPPSGFGSISCEQKVRFDQITDPIEMHP